MPTARAPQGFTVHVPASAGPEIVVSHATGTTVTYAVEARKVTVKTEAEADHLLSVIEGSTLTATPEEK